MGLLMEARPEDNETGSNGVTLEQVSLTALNNRRNLRVAPDPELDDSNADELEISLEREDEDSSDSEDDISAGNDEDLDEDPIEDEDNPAITEKRYKVQIPKVTASTLEYTVDTVQHQLQGAGRFELLTPDEEIVLAKRVASGDQDAFEQFVLANQRLVVSIAKEYQGHGLELSDLIQEGMLGLIRGVQKFNISYKVKFNTYAYWWIEQAVQKAVQKKAKPIYIPEHVGDRAKRASKLTNTLKELNHNTEPDIDELVAVTSIDKDKLIEAQTAVQRRFVSLSKPIGEKGDGELVDLFSDDTQPLTNEAAEQNIMVEHLQTILDRLSAQERDVIESRFGLNRPGPETRDSIGQRLELTREAVNEIEKQALERLRGFPETAQISDYGDSITG
jgi:RNA polymerase primary sigma factor